MAAVEAKNAAPEQNQIQMQNQFQAQMAAFMVSFIHILPYATYSFCNFLTIASQYADRVPSQQLGHAADAGDRPDGDSFTKHSKYIVRRVYHFLLTMANHLLFHVGCLYSGL